MTKQEEIAFFQKYGVCPYIVECKESNGCNGSEEMFKMCRQLIVQMPEIREKVEFT